MHGGRSAVADLSICAGSICTPFGSVRVMPAQRKHMACRWWEGKGKGVEGGERGSGGGGGKVELGVCTPAGCVCKPASEKNVPPFRVARCSTCPLVAGRAQSTTSGAAPRPRESADNAVRASAPVVLRLPPGHVRSYGVLLPHSRGLGCEPWQSNGFSPPGLPGNRRRSASAIPARGFRAPRH
jgi:hypothetical protein